MATWDDYKKNVREKTPEIGKDMDEIEALSQIVGTMECAFCHDQEDQSGNRTLKRVKAHCNFLSIYRCLYQNM